MTTVGVIPCSDASIVELDALLSRTAAFTDRYICVVNSPDAQYCDDLASHLKECSNVEVIVYQAKLGKAEAVRAALSAALKDPKVTQIYQIDAHLKQSPHHVGQLLQLLGTSDLAVYARYGIGQPIIDRHRAVLVALMVEIVNRFAGYAMHDTVCGSRAYSRRFAEIFLSQSQSLSYGLEIEQILIAGKNNQRVAELLVPTKEQADCTAAEKLAVNFIAILTALGEGIPSPVRRELHALVRALLSFEEFDFDGSVIAPHLDVIRFTPVEDGEDGERCYRLS